MRAGLDVGGGCGSTLAGADRVEVGAMLRGTGALWLDDLELAFVNP